MESVRRKPRADALRNRDLLIEAAKEILGKGGPEASLEAVAKHAGVGIGTLYRHFPTREALFVAVYRREVGQLVDLASDLVASRGGAEALRCWLHAFVSLAETKRGLIGTLAVGMTDETRAVFAEVKDSMNGAIERLIRHAREDGGLRQDISVDDLLMTVYGLCYARPMEPGWKEQVLRLLDIFVDGLTVR